MCVKKNVENIEIIIIHREKNIFWVLNYSQDQILCQNIHVVRSDDVFLRDSFYFIYFFILDEKFQINT